MPDIPPLPSDPSVLASHLASVGRALSKLSNPSEAFSNLYAECVAYHARYLQHGTEETPEQETEPPAPQLPVSIAEDSKRSYA